MPRETRARDPVSYADSGSSTPAWMVRATTRRDATRRDATRRERDRSRNQRTFECEFEFDRRFGDDEEDDARPTKTRRGTDDGMKRESRRRRDARGDGTATARTREDAREGRRDATSAKSPARARRGGRDARDDGGREIDDDARIARDVRQKSTKAFTKEPEKARKRREKSLGDEAGKKTPTKKTPAKTTPARGGNATGKEAETAPAAKRGRGRPVGTTKAAMAKRTGDDGGKKAGRRRRASRER